MVVVDFVHANLKKIKTKDIEKREITGNEVFK